MSIANQKANLQDLELQLKEKKESVALEIQNNIKNIEQAQAQLKVLESNVQLAQKRYNMTLTAYNHGSKDLLTLQNASDALMTARDNLNSQKIKIKEKKKRINFKFDRSLLYRNVTIIWFN